RSPALRHVPVVGGLEPRSQRRRLLESSEVAQLRVVEQLALETHGTIRMEEGMQGLAGYVEQHAHDVAHGVLRLTADVDRMRARSALDHSQGGFDRVVHVQKAP